MSDHPLLTRVLADAYAVEFPPIEVPGYIDPANRLREQQAFMERITSAIPPAIADRLEAALDECQYDGFPFPCPLKRSAHGTTDHPYQPLVTPSPEQGA